MNKIELISELNNAIDAHKKWVDNAHSLIEGIILDKTLVPVVATECKFGQWYYAQGQTLKRITYFKEIEKLHNEVHKTYMDIFAILFNENQQVFAINSTILGKLFGHAHNKTEDDKLLASDKYHILEHQSQQMIKKLHQLKKLVNAMSEDQLESFLNMS